MENSTIEFYHNESQLMNDAIDRVVVKVHNYKKANNKKIILLTGCGPCCGVTTMSINLAIALSLSGWKTLLVDCDLRKGSKYKRLGKEAELGLSNYLAKKASIEQIVSKTNYNSLDYISCGTSTGSAVRMLCSAEMGNLIEEMNEQYDYIILDLPSINIVNDATILFPYVDGIILIAALNQTTKKQLGCAKHNMEKVINKYYGLIINQVDLGQYGHHIKDYDYFKQKGMDKRYKNNLKQANKKRKKARKGDIHG